MQLQRGKYQTRTNRIVEITGSKTVLRQQPGIANPVPTRMWEGTLYQMDGKTPESIYTWTDAGGFYGTAQGVASPHDLVNLISSTEPEAQPEPVFVDHQARAEAAEKHAEIMAESLNECTRVIEAHRHSIGAIRYMAQEALAEGSSVNPVSCLEKIVDLSDQAIGKKEVVHA